MDLSVTSQTKHAFEVAKNNVIMTVTRNFNSKSVNPQFNSVFKSG